MAGIGEAQNTVLVAEEDPELRGRVVSYLEAHGLIATVVDSVAAARGALRQNAYGGVILNSTLKGEDCLVIARELLARGGPPVLVTSSRATEMDRVLALDMGADDYLVKPYGFRELFGAPARGSAAKRSAGATGRGATPGAIRPLDRRPRGASCHAR